MDFKPLYSIGLFRSNTRNTDTQLTVFVADKRFEINLLTTNFEDSPAILEAYLRHVRRQEPDFLPDDPEEDLEGKLSPAPIETDPKNSRFVGALLPPSKEVDYSMFPIYGLDRIHVTVDLDSAALPGVPRKASIDGQNDAFFKLVFPGDINSTRRELIAYAKIQSAQFGAEIRTSRLQGVVQDKATGRVVGLLLSYIDCNQTALCGVGTDPNRSSRRQKWIDQITSTLKALHAHQIVWGDAKPANILIDVHDDAYLIDFGGSYTNGWVDKELANTMEGDLQALDKITHYYLRP
ncbi:MAG: hypothetical protein M4579_005777 [Chaenotheca gracillima]|nr:MAG: hypothetical protein M4579_005777 [Chaenotheca gracillima]